MTAIAGIWRLDGRPDARDRIEPMLAVQSIYGPHDQAHWSNGDIGLGRALFRTLPEDMFDRGPVVGGGGALTLVADVRLDNRDDLVGLLAIDRGRAETMCDAQVLMVGFERWDEAVVDHLVGDFAFAVWDAKRHRLVLARDFLGQRPLHYHRGDRFLAFASMPKGLHALAEIPRGPDEERTAEFLASMPESGSRSYFAGVERVEAGHVVTVTPGGLTARRYWNPSRRRLILANQDDYVDGLRHHLDEAVRSRLRGAENHVGAQLSGGLDSSAVAATAARLMAPHQGRVTAFTSVPRAGYDRPGLKGRMVDEGPLAAATAALYPNMDQVLIRGGQRSAIDDLDKDFYLFERPILNRCNMVWSAAINEAARRRKLTVLLVGNAGNMSVSYNGLDRLPELLAKGRWLTLLGEARAMVRTGAARWRGVAAASVGAFIPQPIWSWLNRNLRGIGGIETYSAINPTRFAALDLRRRARDRDLDLNYRPRRDAFATRLWVLRRVDLGNYNMGALGGWGIDQRDPTADRRLVEYCLSVPTEQFLSRGVPRSLALRALADRLPPQVLNEKRKGLQAADWHEGLTSARAALTREIESLSACAPAATALDLARMRSLVDQWPSDGWERMEIKQAYRHALLRGLSAGHFLRKASGANL